jgi:hypothetical protein
MSGTSYECAIDNFRSPRAIPATSSIHHHQLALPPQSHGRQKHALSKHHNNGKREITPGASIATSKGLPGAFFA